MFTKNKRSTCERFIDTFYNFEDKGFPLKQSKPVIKALEASLKDERLKEEEFFFVAIMCAIELLIQLPEENGLPNFDADWANSIFSNN